MIRGRGEAALVLTLLVCLLTVAAPRAHAAGVGTHPHRPVVATALAATAAAVDHSTGRGDQALVGTAAAPGHRPAARHAAADASGAAPSRFTAATVPARGPPAKAR